MNLLCTVTTSCWNTFQSLSKHPISSIPLKFPEQSKCLSRGLEILTLKPIKMELEFIRAEILTEHSHFNYLNLAAPTNYENYINRNAW